MSEAGEAFARRDSLSPAKRALLEQRLQGRGSPAAGEAPIARRPAGAAPLLSPGQERLWFLQQLEPGSTAYVMAQAFRIDGPLDADLLEWSLQQVVQRHEVLRTIFPVRDGQPGVALHQIPFRLSRQDLSSLDETAREERAASLASAEATRTFDLAAGPLLRASLLRLTPARHVLALALHHIVCDEWSLDVFWREAAAFYAAGPDAAPALPALPLQYADYAHWQRSRDEGDVSKRQLEYWREQLGGDLPELVLPTGRPRPLRRHARGDLASAAFPAALAAGVAELSRREGTTPFVVLLAAFKTLLHRYTGATDVIVGSPFTGRTRAELENLVGFFINSLVLRTDLSGDPGFAEVVRRVRTTVLEAMAHQELPFEKLVDALRPGRAPHRNPLFQVMFVLQREAAAPCFSPALQTQPFPVQNRGAKLDLTLFMTEPGTGPLRAALEYDADLFEAGSAARTLEHLGVLLHGAVREAATPISRLPLLELGERRRLLHEWNDTDSAEPQWLRMDGWIAARAQRSPAAVAVASEDQQLTYAALQARAQHLAHRLRALGVGPNVRVGLCAERSVEMVIGMLAILQAGGAYVPLDPAYPDARIRFTLEDTRAPVLLVQDHLAARFTGLASPIVVIEDDASGLEPTADMAASASPDDLVYVIHTSGSTGQPKGVPIRHRNLAHSTAARFSCYAETPERFLLLPSFAFDSSVAGIFWTLCAGGTLVLPPTRIEQDLRALAQLITRERVTHMLCLPSLYALLLEHAPSGSLASLRTVIVAGEACPAALAGMHHALLPATALHNEYGPTEATVWSTVHRVTPEDAAGHVPIGKPIAGTRVYVLDAHQQPVPIGVPGELYIAGAGVADGYLDRPTETAERFLDDPFSEPGGRLYRTGDRVRWRESGVLEFLGRADGQLKVRGHRIEPDEVTMALSQHPRVRESALALRPVRGAGNGVDAAALLDALAALAPAEADALLGDAERLAERAT